MYPGVRASQWTLISIGHKWLPRGGSHHIFSLVENARGTHTRLVNDRESFTLGISGMSPGVNDRSHLFHLCFLHFFSQWSPYIKNIKFWSAECSAQVCMHRLPSCSIISKLVLWSSTPQKQDLLDLLFFAPEKIATFYCLYCWYTHLYEHGLLSLLQQEYIQPVSTTSSAMNLWHI